MNIVLAVDNSPHSQVAIDVVLNRVWPEGSTLKVFSAVEKREHVFAVMKSDEAESFQGKALSAAKTFTEDVSAKIQAKFPKLNVTSEAALGDCKELILDQVNWPADLIVVGSHGRQGLPRLFLGSVSQTVLLYSPVSTLVARYQHAHEGVPKFDKNILIAVDDTPHSRNALDWVAKMPWPNDAKFTLLSVLPAIVDKYSDGIDALYARKFSGERLEIRQSAQKFLDASARRLESKVGAGNVNVDLREGDPAESILFVAGNWPAGLVVMGCRSRGQMTRLFMGSVSQEVVLQAPCPVEVIKRLSDGIM